MKRDDVEEKVALWTLTEYARKVIIDAVDAYIAECCVVTPEMVQGSLSYDKEYAGCGMHKDILNQAATAKNLTAALQKRARE